MDREETEDLSCSFRTKLTVLAAEDKAGALKALLTLGLLRGRGESWKQQNTSTTF